MARIEAIQSNDRRHSCLGAMTQGALIGAAGGYAAKYILPLQSDEKQTPEYQKVMRKINNQKTEYNQRTELFINRLKGKEQLSLAEDKFVKLFDGLKEGEHVKRASIRNAINELKENAPNQLNEFKRICKASSEVVEQTAKQCMNAYNLVTKHIRPTGFFLGAGAITGAIIALIGDIVKTER